MRTVADPKKVARAGRVKEKFRFRFTDTGDRDFRAASLRMTDECFEEADAGVPSDLAVAGLSEADIVRACELQSFPEFPKDLAEDLKSSVVFGGR